MGGTLAGIEMNLSLNPKPHLAQLITDIFPLRPRPVDRVVLEAWDDMPMAMIDGLAGRSALVDDHIEALGAGGGLDRPAQPRQQRARVRGQRLGQLAKLSEVRLGHHQRVPGTDRMNVQEGYNLARLKDTGRGHLPRDDLAEDTVWIVCLVRHDGSITWCEIGVRFMSGVRSPQRPAWSES
jgi:hypothetical protein